MEALELSDDFLYITYTTEIPPVFRIPCWSEPSAYMVRMTEGLL